MSKNQDITEVIMTKEKYHELLFKRVRDTLAFLDQPVGLENFPPKPFSIEDQITIATLCMETLKGEKDAQSGMQKDAMLSSFGGLMGHVVGGVPAQAGPEKLGGKIMPPDWVQQALSEEPEKKPKKK